MTNAVPVEKRKPGRPRKGESQQITKRELKEKELLMLLRKVKPHVSHAVMNAARIMNKPLASDANSLKASVVLLDFYRKLTMDLYDVEDAEELGEEIQESSGNSFSLYCLPSPGDSEE